MKFGLLLMMLTTNLFAQAVYPTDTATNQPLVYRDASGSFNGCGVRTIFMTTVPTPTYMGDVSMNIFMNSNGAMIGMAKVGYAYIPNLNDPKNRKRIPITSFMMANSSGKAAKLMGMKPSEDKNLLISTTSEQDAINFIVDITTEKTVQIGIQLPNEKGIRIFSMKSEPMSREESDQLINCLTQITKTK